MFTGTLEACSILCLYSSTMKCSSLWFPLTIMFSEHLPFYNSETLFLHCSLLTHFIVLWYAVNFFQTIFYLPLLLSSFLLLILKFTDLFLDAVILKFEISDCSGILHSCHYFLLNDFIHLS